MRYRVVFFEILNTLVKVENFEEEVAKLLQSELRLSASTQELADKIRSEWQSRYSALIARGNFRSFRQLARDVIISVVKHYTISLSPQELDYFSNAVSSILVEQSVLYEDASETIQTLNEKGLELYILTNLDNDIAKKILLRYNMLRFFRGVVSSDLSRAGKPSLRIYQAALARAKVAKEQALLVSGLVEDVIGSKLAGMKIVFVNREGRKLDISPDHVVQSLKEVIPIVLEQ